MGRHRALRSTPRHPALLHLGLGIALHLGEPGLARDRDDELAILDRNIYARLWDIIKGKKAVKGPKGFKAGSVVSEETVADLSRGQWWQLAMEDEDDWLQPDLEEYFV